MLPLLLLLLLLLLLHVGGVYRSYSLTVLSETRSLYDPVRKLAKAVAPPGISPVQRHWEHRAVVVCSGRTLRL